MSLILIVWLSKLLNIIASKINKTIGYTKILFFIPFEPFFSIILYEVLMLKWLDFSLAAFEDLLLMCKYF